jgi:hypothetical protein
LEVELVKVSRQGFSALAKLKSLQELLFSLFSDPEHNSGARRRELELCFDFLPQLHVAAYKLTTLSNNVLGYVSSDILSSVTVPRTLQLHFLALDILDTLPQCVSLPQLRVLHLSDPIYEESHQDALDRFPNLTELTMMYTDEPTLMSIIRHRVGLQLRKLSVCINGKISLDLLVEACPGLSELFLINVDSYPESVSKLRSNTLQNLHTLFIACPNACIMQPGLILEIFRLAPNLRNVSLSMVPMAKEDLQELAEMIKQGTCLRKLERFEFPRSSGSSSAKEGRIRDEAIVACSTHCKKLKEFAFVEC